MCAIIDNDVVSESFGDRRTEAGNAFLNAVESHRLPLVVGGKLLDELDENIKFQEWRQNAAQFGTIKVINYQAVENRTKELEVDKKCESNDSHIIALAQLGGARLLFSNDRLLQQDFKSKDLIDRPRGKVFTTLRGTSLSNVHKRLLASRSLCSGGPNES